MIERKEGYPREECHLRLSEDDLLPPRSPTTNLNELRDYFRRELSEVVCVVEASECYSTLCVGLAMSLFMPPPLL